MRSLQGQLNQFVHGVYHGNTMPLPFQQLDHAFEQQAHRNPHTLAVEHEGQKLNYQQLDQRASQLALMLQQKGVTEGACVGIFLERSLEMVIGILAVLKCGATYVPQDARISPAIQLKQVVAVCDIRLVLTLKHLQALMPHNCECLALDRLPNRQNITHIARSRYNPQRKAMILFTSGTTGTPNPVAISHRNICNLISLAPGHLNVSKGMRIAQIMNIAFDMAAWEIFLSLCHGASLLIRGTSIATTARQANILIATPSILEHINPYDCNQLKTVAVAGEPSPAPLANLWARFVDFYNCCGPTEITIINTAKKHRVGDAISIGTPIPNTSVYILDQHHKPCPIGACGELWVGGLGVSDGYLNNATLTKQRYLPDPFCNGNALMFRTRDLGRWTTAGEIEHCGRTDTQVKVKGFRVELSAIDSILEAKSLCSKSVSLYTNNSIITFVSNPSAPIKKMQQTLALCLPYYCIPQTIHALQEFPCTARGKVDRDALLALM